MTVQYSSVIPTMLALRDELDAAAWPQPAPVVAVGGTRDVSYDLVLIGTNVTADQTFAAMRPPPHARTEDYTLDVLVSTTKPGQSTTEALQQLQAMIEVVERVLRDNPAGWGHGVHTIEVTAPTLSNVEATDDGFTVDAVLAVRVQARLQGGT
jgi:hypothetical protein